MIKLLSASTEQLCWIARLNGWAKQEDLAATINNNVDNNADLLIRILTLTRDMR